METIEKYAPQNDTLKAATEREKNGNCSDYSEHKQTRMEVKMVGITKRKQWQ